MEAINEDELYMSERHEFFYEWIIYTFERDGTHACMK